MTGPRIRQYRIRTRPLAKRPATVASLGVVARLVPSRHEADRDLADMIATYHRLRDEFEHLFEAMADLARLQPNRRA